MDIAGCDLSDEDDFELDGGDENIRRRENERATRIIQLIQKRYSCTYEKAWEMCMKDKKLRIEGRVSTGVLKRYDLSEWPGRQKFKVMIFGRLVDICPYKRLLRQKLEGPSGKRMMAKQVAQSMTYTWPRELVYLFPLALLSYELDVGGKKLQTKLQKSHFENKKREDVLELMEAMLWDSLFLKPGADQQAHLFVALDAKLGESEKNKKLSEDRRTHTTLGQFYQKQSAQLRQQLQLMPNANPDYDSRNDGNGNSSGGNGSGSGPICSAFNTARGCYRKNCNLRHVCDYKNCNKREIGRHNSLNCWKFFDDCQANFVSYLRRVKGYTIYPPRGGGGGSRGGRG